MGEASLACGGIEHMELQVLHAKFSLELGLFEATQLGMGINEERHIFSCEDAGMVVDYLYCMFCDVRSPERWKENCGHRHWDLRFA